MCNLWFIDISLALMFSKYMNMYDTEIFQRTFVYLMRSVLWNVFTLVNNDNTAFNTHVNW
jgi:hypothetical protein